MTTSAVVKDRPINLRDWEVRAFLAGHKTQTRRPIKPQPECDVPGAYLDAYNGGPEWCWWTPKNLVCNAHETVTCPFGKPGDRLWGREVWALVNNWGEDGLDDWEGDIPRFRPISPLVQAWYREGHPWGNDSAADRGFRWRSPVGMPRWASRITLEITNVRVERVREISREDAIAEGATSRDIGPGVGWSMDWSQVGSLSPYASGVTNRAEPKPLNEYDVSLVMPWAAFGNAWIKTYGPDSWDRNEWVWVLEHPAKGATP